MLKLLAIAARGKPILGVGIHMTGKAEPFIAGMG
jgi:hypothetical protein